jgi:hypothetical protein
MAEGTMRVPKVLIEADCVCAALSALGCPILEDLQPTDSAPPLGAGHR